MKKLAVTILPILLFLACQKAPPVIEYFEYVDDHSVPRISAEDAKKEFDAGNAVFVDSRGEGAWKAERLPGALEISMGASDEKLSTLPKGKKIIVYCS